MKKRKIIWGFCLLFAALAVLPSCKKKNEVIVRKDLVSNGGAETESAVKEGEAEDWRLQVGEFHAPNNYFYSRTDEEFFDGGFSLKLEAPSVDDSKEYGYLRQELQDFEEIPFGTEVTLSARVKTKDLNGKGFFVTVYGENLAGEAFYISTSDFYPVVQGDTNWKEYSVNFSFDQQAARLYMFIGLNPSTTGSVYFDEVSLSYLGAE